MDKSEELVAANLVLPILKDLVMPKVKSIIKKFSIKTIDENLIEANFQEYLSQRYEKYLIIDTLVFPNKQTLFKSLYEPLTIITNEGSQKEIEIKIEDYPRAFLPKYFRAIIEDTAGMGKSTIIKKLFLSIIEQNEGIPILIELRQINKENSFLRELQNQLSGIGKSLSMDIILKLINEGEFIFLFDGFDEISISDREFVIKDLHKFIEKANNNYFLITSRQEDSLVSFGDFQKFKVKPLVEKEAYSLIERYDSYSYKPIAHELLNQLKEKQDETLTEFLSNPFLVSLLYKSFEYKKDIPIKKCQFYRQVYDALFESHDLSKEGYLKRDKYSNLHLDDFERVLRHIGYLTSIENKIEYDKNYIINIIDKAKKHVSDLSFKSSDYLKDLLETVPLFKKDGNYIKWAHKSLQDYFSAKFIWIDARKNQSVILRKIYDDENNPRFFNILDLFYELDPKVFENTILLWLLEDFNSYCNVSYKELSYIPESLLKVRIENTFCKESSIWVARKDEYERIAKFKSVWEFIDDYLDQYIEYNHVFVSDSEQSDLVFFTFTTLNRRVDSLLKLISTKMTDLVNEDSYRDIKKATKKLKEGNTYEVNDNPDNILNDKTIFGFINDLLVTKYSLKYDNSLKRLQEITAIKKRNLENELINW